jgi:hypothetical protein
MKTQILSLLSPIQASLSTVVIVEADERRKAQLNTSGDGKPTGRRHNAKFQAT